MKNIEYDKEKDKLLKKQRGIGFKKVVKVIENNQIVIKTDHPSKKYPHQKVFVLNINDYIYIVPFVEDDKKIFLKTIYPSRKFTKYYLKK